MIIIIIIMKEKSSKEIKELNIIDKCVSNKYESHDRNPKVKSIIFSSLIIINFNRSKKKKREDTRSEYFKKVSIVCI